MSPGDCQFSHRFSFEGWRVLDLNVEDRGESTCNVTPSHSPIFFFYYSNVDVQAYFGGSIKHLDGDVCSWHFFCVLLCFHGVLNNGYLGQKDAFFFFFLWGSDLMICHFLSSLFIFIISPLSLEHQMIFWKKRRAWYKHNIGSINKNVQLSRRGGSDDRGSSISFNVIREEMSSPKAGFFCWLFKVTTSAISSGVEVIHFFNFVFVRRRGAMTCTQRTALCDQFGSKMRRT